MRKKHQHCNDDRIILSGKTSLRLLLLLMVFLISCNDETIVSNSENQESLARLTEDEALNALAMLNDAYDLGSPKCIVKRKK